MNRLRGVWHLLWLRSHCELYSTVDERGRTSSTHVHCSTTYLTCAMSQHSPRACSVVCAPSARSQKIACTRTRCAAVREPSWWQKWRNADGARTQTAEVYFGLHTADFWPKSDFFAQMWPISDFLMTVWTAQIRFFQIRPRPLSYVVLNRIHIRCFAMRLQSERPCCISCDFSSLKCDRRHNSALEEAGRLKSQCQTIISLSYLGSDCTLT